MKGAAFIFILICFFAFETKAQNNQDGRPKDFPVPPKTENSLFFIQRNKNENTIVYDAKILEDGSFDNSGPIDAYWLRYTSTGYRRELSWLERNFAYGYSFKKDKNGNGHWIELTAYDGRKIHLKKTEKGKPLASITCNGKECRLDYIYVFADESGSWPKVIFIDLHATELSTGKQLVERIRND